MSDVINGLRAVDGYLNLYSKVGAKEKKRFRIITIKKLWQILTKK